MTGTTILAIDLGKYKCVSCTYDRVTAAAEFRTITTSRAEVERLIRGTSPSVVVIEACTLAGWVSDLCGELGVRCKVATCFVFKELAGVSGCSRACQSTSSAIQFPIPGKYRCSRSRAFNGWRACRRTISPTRFAVKPASTGCGGSAAHAEGGFLPV